MPRKLPWLRDAVQPSLPTPQPRISAPHPSTASRNRAEQAPPDGGDGYDDDDDLNTTGVTTPQRRARLRTGRSPSSSPIRPPPRQEPMRRGWDADDAWMMVEDEFLSTAQLFTSHLHQAEYRRLKALARQRAQHGPPLPSSAVGDGDGDGDGGGLAGYVSPRRTATRNENGSAKRQIQGGNDSGDDGVPWVGDPMLAGLMDRPRMAPPVLKREPTSRNMDEQGPVMPPCQPTDQILLPLPGRQMGSATTNVREELIDDDNDDLDLLTSTKQVQKTKAKTLLKQEPCAKPWTKPILKSSSVLQNLDDDDLDEVESPSTFKSIRVEHYVRGSDKVKPKARKIESTEDLYNSNTHPSAGEKLAAVLAKRKDRLETKRRKDEAAAAPAAAARCNDVTASEIPTFMV